MSAVLKNYSLLFLVLALFFFCKVTILFLVPGILLIYYLENEKASALSLKVVGCSLSFWMAAFWFLKYIPISLTNLFNYCFIATIAVLLYFGTRKLKVYYPIFNRESIFFFILLIFTAILRFLPMYTIITPSGADMSMHAYMTALISIYDGVPLSYLPIFNIPKFNTFPVGFHTISALISHASDLSFYRSTFVLSCIACILTTHSLYLLVRQFVCLEIAAVAAFFFTFLTSTPQSFACWGGNPTVLSFVFAILFLNEILQLKDNKKYTITAAFFLTAVFLTHTIIFIQSFYIVGISLLLYLFFQNKKFTLARRLFGVVLLFSILVSAYLLQIDIDVITPNITDWIKNWVRNTGHAWHGTILNCWWSVPRYILKQIMHDNGRSALVVFIGIIGFIFQVRKKNGTLFAWLIPFILMPIILIINTRYWKLPFSYAIYPERTAMFVIIPLAVLFAAGLEYITQMIKSRSKKSKGIAVAGYSLVVLFLAIVPPLYNTKKFIHGIEAGSSVTQDDLNAFAWLTNNTNDEDITQTNYGDAGIWIPAIIHRKVTTAHINVMHLNSYKQYTRKPKFVFVGSKCVYQEDCSETFSKYFGNPDYDLVYKSNNSCIFKLKE